MGFDLMGFCDYFQGVNTRSIDVRDGAGGDFMAVLIASNANARITGRRLRCINQGGTSAGYG